MTLLARAEIRAPRAQVLAVAALAPRAAQWLWAETQVADPAGTRDLPDGTRQLINGDGDKLRDRVVSSSPDEVVIDSALVPRKADRPGRNLRYTLKLKPGAGTTHVELALDVVGQPELSAIDQRRWRRHAEQCVARLQLLCEGPPQEPESAADGATE